MAELLVGRVLEADDHPGSRAPSFRVKIDLGPRGEVDAQMDPGGYAKDALADTLVVVSLEDGEAIVLQAHSHARGPVLLRPDESVEPGTLVA
jgi:hypothetical protein